MNKTDTVPKVGFSGYDPEMTSRNGPVVSLNRMARSMANQGRILPRQASRWRNDLNIHVVTAPRFMFTPSILRVDGIAFDSENTLGDTEALNRPVFRSLRQVDGVFYISEFSRKLIEAFAGPQNKPHVVIHNSVDLDIFHPEGRDHREELGWGQNDLVFVASAKWRRWKRLPETLEWFHRFKLRYSGVCRLLILGDGEFVPTEDPDVFYAGGYDPQQLPSWYRTGDVFVHLATLEACGNTQIEAMACGLPVLCCPNGGIRETVEKANGGIVSECDPPYEFNKVKHYSPAAPDYDILLRDSIRLVEDLEGYRRRLSRSALDVNAAAGVLADFCENLLEALEGQSSS